MKNIKLQHSNNTIFSNLRFELFLLDLKIKNWLLDWKNKQYRKKYCRKGLHKIVSAWHSQKKGDKRTIRVNFLTCKYCNYVFFANSNSKKRYLKMNRIHSLATQKMIKSMVGGL